MFDEVEPVPKSREANVGWVIGVIGYVLVVAALFATLLVIAGGPELSSGSSLRSSEPDWALRLQLAGALLFAAVPFGALLVGVGTIVELLATPGRAQDRQG